VRLLGSLRQASAALVLVIASGGGALGAPQAALPATSVLEVASTPAGHVSAVTEVSRCPGQNAEVEEAAAPPRYVYAVWIGCDGIGFARSTDDGLHFGKPVPVPGSRSSLHSWDPSIAVSPGGTVYVAYMTADSADNYPVVVTSANHGVSFSHLARLRPHVKGDDGDRDFIAAGRHGNVYVTWDYAPNGAVVTGQCSRSGGSCWFTAGDLNAVIQKSADGGRRWGPITPVGPGFPRNGGVSAPVLVRPDGRVDVLYRAQDVGRPPRYILHPGHEIFASSASGRRWPSRRTEIGPSSGSIAVSTWWIDGDLAADSADDLFATWDTQTPRGDIGWLSDSRDGGRSWGRPVRVTPDHTRATHIVEVAGGRPGIAYVAWQTDASPRGYATYLRPFSVTRGWLTAPIRVSGPYGSARIWPGDTFGVTTLPSTGPAKRVALSWGSAIGRHRNSEIYAAVVTLPGLP
jgi:hypothetical protein